MRPLVYHCREHGGVLLRGLRGKRLDPPNAPVLGDLERGDFADEVREFRDCPGQLIDIGGKLIAVGRELTDVARELTDFARELIDVGRELLLALSEFARDDIDLEGQSVHVTSEIVPKLVALLLEGDDFEFDLRTVFFVRHTRKVSFSKYTGRLPGDEEPVPRRTEQFL